MTIDPWSRSCSSRLPAEEAQWTCPDCGHTGMTARSPLEKLAPTPFVTMGVRLKRPSRLRRFTIPAARRFTLCGQCDLDNMVLHGLPELERMVMLRHVHRLGVISRRQLIEEQIMVYVEVLDDSASFRMPEDKVIISASRLRTLRAELAALEEADPQG